MINQYKLTISNQNIYKEIDLPVDEKTYSVGTTVDCNYRLRKEYFFDDIKLTFFNEDANWSLMCSDNVYIATGDAQKLLIVRLHHGDSFEVLYQNSNNVVFKMTFGVDFDSRKVKYERCIDVKKSQKIAIGTDSRDNISVKSEYLFDDEIILTRDRQVFRLQIQRATYGVYHNGNLAMDGEIIEDGDFFSISDYPFYFRNEEIWTLADNSCVVNGLPVHDYITKNHYPVFQRNTRINSVVDESPIEILDPPSLMEKPKTNLLMSLLPSLGMLIAAGVMASRGGATMMMFSGVSAVMAIITAVVGLIEGNKDYKKQTAKRNDEYNTYAVKKKSEITADRKKELDTLNQIYISKDKEYEEFGNFSSDLFDRTPKDPDFLSVRLGIGNIEAKRVIGYKKKEKLEIEDDLQKIPAEISKEFKYLINAPVVCNLRDLNGLGIVGNEKYRYEMFKSILIDMVARQFYDEVNLYFIATPEHKKIAEEIRFLPHLQNDAINARNIVCDEDSKKQIFEYLYTELSNREQGDAKDVAKKNRIVVFLYDLYGFTSHPISKFASQAKDLGVTFIFFGDARKDIPLGCEQIVSILDDSQAELIKVDNELEKTSFQYDHVNDSTLQGIVQLLAPVCTDEISLEGSLTKSINLFELLNIFGVEDLNLKERWKESKVYKSLAVPLGVSKTGEVYLNLHDKADGPHGLVAGTTGSGKSELLQTFILSIATYFHPYDISFLIIDFKGGGMVNQFKELPHLIGAITNIDGKEIDRSLKSIKAELHKREKYFADAKVNHIDAYIKKYKAGEVQNPLPHLIIIVDEFAELKAEQPDFMKELISTARVGRSLGVHLILATQKPAGQVDEQIWSNSRFKLCLKVQSPEDSKEVLKSPLAAEIKEPGRAYLQVGNNETFELFQSAYSGASEKAVDNQIKPFKVSSVDVSGKRKVIYELKNKSTGEKGKTQLEAIVKYVHDYCTNNKIAQLPSICLASLPKKIFFEQEKYDKVNDKYDIGIYDDPDNQYQGSTFIDCDGKNTFILGASQYGKTNLVQLLIREIANKYTSEEANIYIMDFASMVLKGMETLNHVGGVVTASDDEKLRNLFKLIIEEIARRKEIIVSKGVSSFNAYVEAGEKDLPRIFLFVDNFTALYDLYLEDNDAFLTILREGLSVGISTIVTNPQTSGIGYKYLSNFANRVVFHCNEKSEYSNMLNYSKMEPDDAPGRCLLELNKQIMECQTYLAFKGEKEFERAKEIQAFIEERNAKNPVKAREIPYIPAILTQDNLQNNFKAPSQGYRIPIGVSYLDVEPFYLNFSSIGSFGICGKTGRGHFNFISNLLLILEAEKDTHPSKVFIFDDVTKKYKNLTNLDVVHHYTIDSGEVAGVLSEWSGILEDRYQAMIEERNSVDNDLLLLVIQNNDVASVIAKDKDMLGFYKDIFSRYAGLNACIIFADFRNVSLPYDAPEPLKIIKAEKHLVFLDDLDNLKAFDISYDYIRANKKKVQQGDAYYIHDDELYKLKLVKSEYNC